jgi:hypothetical protein
VKQGILLDAVNFACPAPTTAGFSINYLVEAAFQEVDGGSTVLPYYNAANPAQAFNGPNGTGTSNTTFRDNTVQLQLKAGTAATTGTQTTPAVDSGFTGLWVITVAFGAVTITSANISQFTGAPFLTAPLLTQIQQGTGVVGVSRNVAAVQTTAAATLTVNIGQVQVETVAGLKYTVPSFSATFNGATVGANGMDTGSIPASSFLALYAIYNPTTQASALLASSAASTRAEIYGGANMPAGYTASALITVVPTNASSLIVPCVVMDRSVDIANVTAMSTNTVAASPTQVNNLAVPPNAKNFSGQFTAGNTSVSTVTLTLYSSAASTGAQTVGIALTASGSNSLALTRLKLSTAQRMFYSATSTAGTPNYTVVVNSYEI